MCATIQCIHNTTFSTNVHVQPMYVTSVYHTSCFVVNAVLREWRHC